MGGIRTVKARANANVFRNSPDTFGAMVDDGIAEEDVKRAFSTVCLPGIRAERRRGMRDVLQGYDMDGGEPVLVCPLLRQSIEVADLYRA